MTHEIVFYRAPDGNQQAVAPFLGDTFRVPQKTIAGLDPSVVSVLETTARSKQDELRQRQERDSLRNPGELIPGAALSILETVRQERPRQIERNPRLFDRGVRSRRADCTHLQVPAGIPVFDGHLMGQI